LLNLKQVTPFYCSVLPHFSLFATLSAPGLLWVRAPSATPLTKQKNRLQGGFFIVEPYLTLSLPSFILATTKVR
jgi:hypothetical protein